MAEADNKERRMFKLTQNALPRFSLLFATLSLAACGGGGGGGSSDGGSDPAPVATAVDPGLFDTRITYASGAEGGAFTLLSPSGKYATVVIGAPNGTFGTMNFDSDPTFSGTGTNVFFDGSSWDSVSGSLEGKVASSQKLTATFTPNTADPDSVSEITLVRDENLSDRKVTIEEISGDYSMDRRTRGGVLTNVVIKPDGLVEGSDSEGCVISGSITVDNTYNVFEGDLLLESCGDIANGPTGEQRGGNYDDIVGSYDPSTNDIVFAGTNGKVMALFISD